MALDTAAEQHAGPCCGEHDEVCDAGECRICPNPESTQKQRVEVVITFTTVVDTAPEFDEDGYPTTRFAEQAEIDALNMIQHEMGDCGREIQSIKVVTT